MTHDFYNNDCLEYDYEFDQIFSQSSTPISLDKYRETGVYIEEEKDGGDLLIVLGEPVLEGVIQQFYISSDYHAYTRSYWNAQWASWHQLSQTQLDTQSIDLNSFRTPDFFLVPPNAILKNAPKEACEQTGYTVIRMIALLDYHHHIQFLVSQDRKSFWIRHYDGESWSLWSSFY